ncbi:cell envelope integrity protein TolA [Orbus wheelerorum]|uniref:cell envelope integrity protein TolA n=1 Tax=Orbus wheelerorum TaxID=3074111 RepID=UPI00370D8E84
MPKKINSRFSLALITSIILHVGVIAVLGYSAWHYASTDSGNNVQSKSIDAIMVDSNIMSEQYQRQLQHKLTSQQVKQQQQEQIEKQAQELQQKQLAEQQRLKTLEKERLLAVEKQKQQAEQAKIALEEQQKQALIAQQKSEQEAQLRAQAELKEQQRLDIQRKQAELATQKALAEAEQAKQEAEKQKQILEQQRLNAEKEKQEKIKAAQDAKKKVAEEQQKQQAVDDILGGLTSNVPKSQQSVSSADSDQFKSQVNNAISNKFINPKLYSGKNCVLNIEIFSDGSLLRVTAESGDPVLCREAISATKLAKLPKPKNDQLYQKMKNLTIDFRPKQ